MIKKEILIKVAAWHSNLQGKDLQKYIALTSEAIKNRKGLSKFLIENPGILSATTAGLTGSLGVFNTHRAIKGIADTMSKNLGTTINMPSGKAIASVGLNSASHGAIAGLVPSLIAKHLENRKIKKQFYKNYK